LLRQLLKYLQERNASSFNECFRSAIHRFKVCSEEKSQLKRLVFVRSVLATAQSVQESIESCIKSKSSLPTILSCLNVREKPIVRFRFSETNKGKTIKLLDPYTAVM